MAQQNHRIQLSLVIALFFLWGFLTAMNDILIPFLKNLFALSYFQAMLVQFAFFGAYFLGSLLYYLAAVRLGDPIARMGYKQSLVYGLLLSATGAGLFYPAAVFAVYPLFLTALFVTGLGFTLLQITANPFVTVLGRPASAAQRLSLAQGFNSLGTTLAPPFGGLLLLRWVDQNPDGAAVQSLYLGFAGAIGLLALAVFLAPLPTPENRGSDPGPLHLRSRPRLQLGMIAIFMYVGAEVAVGSFLINFLSQADIAGLPEHAAAPYVALYWGGLMVGRFLGSFAPQRRRSLPQNLLMLTIPTAATVAVAFFFGTTAAASAAVGLFVNLIAFVFGAGRPARTTTLFALCAVGLLMLGMLTHGRIAMWSILALGLFNSVMWPNIFTLSIEGLGDHKNQGSSLLVMAIVGGALLPILQGACADRLGIQTSFVVPILAYLVIALFGRYADQAAPNEQASGAATLFPATGSDGRKWT